MAEKSSSIITRRQAIQIASGSLASLILSGCAGPGCYYRGGSNGGGNLPLTEDGTGVRELDTPSQILSNPYVANLVSNVRDEGYSPSFHTAIDPPVISGRYDLGGRRFYPISIQLSPGTFIWRNQTADNHIDTEYDQLFQTGVSSLGEIIRGRGNSFTVYSILRVRDPLFDCDEETVMIVDGEQGSSGNVSAIYLITPVDDSQCYVPTAGELDLTLTGAARAKQEDQFPEGVLLQRRE